MSISHYLTPSKNPRGIYILALKLPNQRAWSSKLHYKDINKIQSPEVYLQPKAQYTNACSNLRRLPCHWPKKSEISPATAEGGQIMSWSPAIAMIGTLHSLRSSLYLTDPSRLFKPPGWKAEINWYNNLIGMVPVASKKFKKSFQFSVWSHICN